MTPDLTAWTGEARTLAARIAAFIDGSLAGAPPEPFERLALALHTHQADHCRVRAALTDSAPTCITEIPAVPVGLFRDLRVGTIAPDEPHRTFLTSGTTTARRGAHHLRSTSLYDHGAVRWARRCLPAWPARTVNLLLDPAAHPESSLAHMVASFAPESSSHQRGTSLDLAGFRAALAEAPAFIGATGFALAELLAGDPAPLPQGCTLMVTGGFKGRAIALSDAELYARARAALRPTHLVTEYGMTELSSQLWGTPEAPYRPPPWLRAIAIDPMTGDPLPAGQLGQLRFIDLCNLDSSVAIETLDRGVVHADGALTLHGRLPDAPARGCSLTLEPVDPNRGAR